MKNRKKTNVKTKILLYIYDCLSVIVCCYLAFLISLYNETDEYLKNIFIFSAIVLALTIILFSIFKLYSSLWKYAGIEEATKVLFAILIIFIFNMSFSLITGIINDGKREFLPLRWCYVFSMLQLLMTLLVRFFYRGIRYIFTEKNKANHINSDIERVMIVGAGDACQALIKEIRKSNKLNMVPVCVIDDDPNKKGFLIEGIKIEGNRNDIPRFACYHNVKRIIIAITSIEASQLSKIIFICQDTKCKIQILPNIYQLMKNINLINNVRDVNIEDLLGRDPIDVNYDEISSYLADQVVLITGGGGFIGSELCRQIAKSNPNKLVIVDYYENNAYQIQQELLKDYPNLNLVTLLASVRDEIRIDDIFAAHKPNIVYHAAAHKHVSLMEESPDEAIKNNVFGTLNVVKASDKYGVRRFIMISTDKVVNPTNVMGASKRICEMIVQSYSKKSKTEFVATRFGNVIGSNDSVIPLFKKQIESGGPVTVSDKDIVRYFMTISEAVSLVLQAGSYAKGGEIFVLDMGKPVKIYDLAVNLIKLSCYTPNEDIEIKIIGTRPDEKIHEEILINDKKLENTLNDLIYICNDFDFNVQELEDNLDLLAKEIKNGNSDIRSIVQKIVPTYRF